MKLLAIDPRTARCSHHIPFGFPFAWHAWRLVAAPTILGHQFLLYRPMWGGRWWWLQ
jgi:hypothetical protein